MFDIVETGEAINDTALLEPAPLHPADTADELLAILGRIDRLQAQAATALARLNEQQQWRRRGYTSATAYLKHRAAMSAGRAMSLVTRANALTATPLTAAAFTRGELTVDQVDILCGAHNFNPDAYRSDEAMLVGLAVQLPFVAELHRLVEYWKQRIDPAATEFDQDMLNSLRGVRIRRDNGVGRAYVCLNQEEFDIWINSLDPGPPAPEDHRNLAQRRADRLIEHAATTMDRPQLVVHVDLNNLTRAAPSHNSGPTPPRGAHPLAETEYGSVLTPSAIARLACDATVCRVVFGPDRQPLDVGRQRRLFTEPQRRAITARDRHCRFPGCDRPPRWCDLHHIQPWQHGGPTNTTNAVLLCRFHHTLIHEVGWTLTGTPTHITIHDDLGHHHNTSTLTPPTARAP